VVHVPLARLRTAAGRQVAAHAADCLIALQYRVVHVPLARLRTAAGCQVAAHAADCLIALQESTARVCTRAAAARGAYKRRDDNTALCTLVSAVAEAVPIKFSGDSHEVCNTSHDAFDALVCALVARAIGERQTRRARSDSQISRTATEGWIHVPKKTSTLAAPRGLTGVVRPSARLGTRRVEKRELGRYVLVAEACPGQ
jgi:hypothetical protein